MKMKRFAAAVLVAVMLFPTITLADGDDIEYSGEYQAFEQIAEYISELYIDDSYSKEDVMAKGLSSLLENDNALLVKLLKSTLESLDDYSEFYTEDEYKTFQDQLNHTFYGIGIVMKLDGDYVIIDGFAEGTDNAKNAGFQIGDKIYKVNGTDVTGMSMSAVRELIIGEEGTTVKITVLREDKEIDLTAERIAVNTSSVYSGILDGNIGYIQITSFSSDTAEEFEKALDYMRENKVAKIILDLRGNGGGFVDAAVSIAQSIVPEGKIIDVKYRQSKYNYTYTSSLKKKEFDFAVLINENTASASEILASAIQDSGAGKLVGETSFGKAVIQSTYPLQNGSVFKLTVGEYITRNGREINRKGLEPDEFVENIITKLDTSQFEQFDYKERTALGEKSGNALAAKQRLSVLGYFDGESNDIFDLELFDAIKTYQLQNGIFSYGIIDMPTQTLLEEQASNVNVLDDMQMWAAYKLLGGEAQN